MITRILTIFSGMMSKTSYKFNALLIWMLMYGWGIKAQTITPSLQGLNGRSSSQRQAMAKLMEGAVEDPSSRTRFSSTYKAADGKVIYRYSSQILNYKDENGNLQPIDIKLHSDGKGWVADQQPSPCYFRLDRSTAISLGNGEEVEFNVNSSINGAAYDERIASMGDDSVALDLASGIHKKITFTPNNVETDYTLDKSIGAEVTVSEELKFPANYKMIRDEMRGKESKYGWSGDYVLISTENNEVVARFQAPLCTDAKGNWCVGSYNIVVKNDKTLLKTIVPASWLAKAVYPIIIDPKVTGSATYQYVGKTTPSCVYPSFETDTIYNIVMPAGVTLTHYQATYSFQSTIPTAAGVWYFTTSCGDSVGVFGCSGILSGSPGSCYINNFELLPYFSSSCYVPSCTPKTTYLVAHLSRYSGYAGGNACDTNSVWYSQYIDVAAGRYPFSVTIVGYPVGGADTTTTGVNTSLVVTPGTPQCADKCTLQMQVNAGYGIPPYKITHPWSTQSFTVGAYSPGTFIGSGSATLTLTIPNCPEHCVATNTITVPPPVVTDACGNIGSRWPVKTVVLKEVPDVTTSSALSVCSGNPIQLALNSCVNGSTFAWTGSDGLSGSGNNIVDPVINTSKTNPYNVIYTVIGSAPNGCTDTVAITGTVNPLPAIGLIAEKDTIASGVSDNLSASGGSSYLWYPSTGLSCSNCFNPVATPSVTTEYHVTITNSEGCTATDSTKVVVLDVPPIVSNVITPNGDRKNEYFTVKGLQYYSNSNSLEVFDRWGKEVFSSANYTNNWNGGNLSAGTYYYALTLSTGKKSTGFFELIR